MEASRLEPGTFPSRPESGPSGKFPLFAPEPPAAPPPAPAPAGPTPPEGASIAHSARTWLERVARVARRRGRFALAVLGGLAALDALVAVNWTVTQRAQATVLVDPARSLDADLRARLPVLSERLGSFLAQATSDSFFEGEVDGSAAELASVHWLDEALDPRAANARAERWREQIALSVEGLDRSPVIHVRVHGEHSATVALIASRVAGRLVALDRAFRADDARARREGAARDPALAPSTLERADAELTAFRRDNPSVALETEASIRAQLEGLEARHAPAAELTRARELAIHWPELRARLTRLEGERDRAAAALEAARRRLELAERLAAVELGTAPDGARVERLVLADPVWRLEPPEGPDRAVVFLVGLVVAGIAAALASIWRELRDRSLHTGEDAARALGLPVLGVIPRLRGRR